MTKILLSGVVGMFIFSGCLGKNEIKPSTPKLEVNAIKVKDTTAKIENQKVETPPESSMKDEIIEEEVEISDDTKPQIIESVE